MVYIIEAVQHVNKGFQGRREPTLRLKAPPRKTGRRTLHFPFKVIIWVLHVQGSMAAQEQWTKPPKSEHMLVQNDVS